MGPILPPTNLDVLLLMGRVPGSSAVAASRYEHNESPVEICELFSISFFFHAARA